MSEAWSQGWKVFRSLTTHFLCWRPIPNEKLPLFSSYLWVDYLDCIWHAATQGALQKPSSEVFVSLSVSAPWIRCYCLLLLEGVCWLSCGALCKLVSCLVVVHVPILLPYLCPSTQAGGEGCRKPLFEVPSNKKTANCTKKSPLQLWDQ